ncbi:glycoside hydrolase 5 family protein [Blautia sp. HCP3S3_G3]|uniref:glycoside hydrolase 5 family protein n=1 Tax=Blautia sp. HCP3S3_G3 TaxID=3438913 RepID=UPI003F88965C
MNLLKKGTFTVGCNYWASHAGTNMWREWRPDIVKEDMKRLAEYGVRTLRVFPLWPDFQPVRAMYGQAGVLREYRMGEEPLPDTWEGQCGVSIEALEKFEEFCRLAEQYGITLIVGLITGWMSGRLYVPEALQGKNIIRDPAAIMWQVRYVRCFVRHFRDSKAIEAWDLGNECNCLAPFEEPEELYAWASAIAGAIRMEDGRRPIISGMHGLLPEGKWNIRQQAELTDVLTTHPYPLFTPWCDAAPINTIRTELHGTAETLLYRGIGRKPCFVEEAGTLGNMLGDEETAAAFVRTCLYSLWAHDCRGYLWWCANEQSHLMHAPYDWCAVERELGLFHEDQSPKTVVKELKEFTDFLEKFPMEVLPERVVDGVCILTHGQDAWANAYMSFILAKQAGMDLEFIYAEQKLPESKCYFMPGICGDSAITKGHFLELMKKVEDGACLYLSLDDGLISGIERFCHVHSRGRMKSAAEKMVRLEEEKEDLPIFFSYQMYLEPEDAQVLAADEDGIPVCTVCSYGKGHVILMAAPLEMTLARRDQRVNGTPGYYKIYEKVKEYAPGEKAASIDKGTGNSNVGLTEHIVSEHERILVFINYDPEPAEISLKLSEGWEEGEYIRGSLQLSGNDCCILKIRHNHNVNGNI